jgi:hypothetical protein
MREALEGKAPHLEEAWPDEDDRRASFCEAHPHVSIEHKPWPGPHWEARWETEDGTAGLVSDVWLEPLLETLEAREW